MNRAPVINGARFRASLMGFEGWVCQSHATASWTAVAEMQGASLHRRHRFREVSDFLLTLTRRPTCERGVAPRPARPSKLQQRRAARIDSLCSPFRQSVAVYLRCAPVPRRCRVCVSTGPSSIFRLRKRTAPRLDREPFTPVITGTQSRRDAIIFMGLPHHVQQRPLGPRHSNAAPSNVPTFSPQNAHRIAHPSPRSESFGSLTSSSATSLRITPAPTGLRIIAKGCRASARPPWYRQTKILEAKPALSSHTAPASSVCHALPPQRLASVPKHSKTHHSHLRPVCASLRLQNQIGYKIV